MNIHTRPARSDEFVILWDIYVQALAGYISQIWGWEEAWQRRDFAEAFGRSAPVVIELDGVVSGYYQMQQSAPDEYADYLRMLILKPEAQSKGVGAHVLRQIVRDLGALGRQVSLRVFRVNPRARRFYEREGWVVVSEDEVGCRMVSPRLLDGRV